MTKWSRNNNIYFTNQRCSKKWRHVQNGEMYKKNGEMYKKNGEMYKKNPLVWDTRKESFRDKN